MFTSSTHHPGALPVASVPSRKRIETNCEPRYGIKSTTSCTQPPDEPTQAARPASGFSLGQVTSTPLYPPDTNVASYQMPPLLGDTSKTPPSQAAEPVVSKL